MFGRVLADACAMAILLAVLVLVVALAVTVHLVRSGRARGQRAAVPGGSRRDYFGDRMPRTDAPR